MEATLVAASEVSFGLTSGASTKVPPATPPTNVPPTEVLANLAQVSIIKVTPIELANKNSAPTPPANASQAKA